MKVWEKRQADKGYLTWSEFTEAIEEDREGVNSLQNAYTHGELAGRRKAIDAVWGNRHTDDYGEDYFWLTEGWRDRLSA